MDIIPLIYIKNRKLRGAIEGKMLFINELPEQSDAGKLYVKDIDGIERDEPNLDIYQKLSEKHDLWVDAGPRMFGDVVDIIMAGATSITLRKNLFPTEEISNIKEVTETAIYINTDLKDEKQDMASAISHSVDGLVISCDGKQIEDDFKISELFRTMCNKYKVYVAELDEKNISYWTNIGVAGVLLDLETMKKVSKDG